MYNHIDRLLGIEGMESNAFTGSTFSVLDPINFSLKDDSDSDVKIYENDRYALSLEITDDTFEGNPLRRRRIKIKNCGEETHILNTVNSLYVSGIGEGTKWYEKGRFLVHYTDCCWQGEFQWKTADLQSFSIFPFSTHQNPAEKVFSSVGSWNTLKHYPMILLEDTLEHRTYIFEIESPDSWSIAIGNLKEELSDGGISVCLSAANMLIDGWQLSLSGGEEYTAATAVYGSVEGSVDEAIKALTEYKRATDKAPFKNRIIPVIYNVYMNGIWSLPTEENLIPLIDATAEAGVEIFCIDAGWHSSVENPCTSGLGDWEIAQDRFPTMGLKGIIDYINKKGMSAGVWLEIEAVLSNAKAAKLSPHCLLKRNGKTIGGFRNLFDFNNSAVLSHLEQVFDNLYKIGVRYIKNDFNKTAGVGFDTPDCCRSEAVRRNSNAFLAFIEKIRRKYPDLIIENCGSGGLRSGYAVLSNFHIQSITDQEIYQYIPSIAAGSLLCMPPEKAGIWCMPYPVRYNDRLSNINSDFVNSHFKGDMATRTVFDMSSGFLGAMYLGGRPDLCHEQSKQILKDVISAYKDVREVISTSHYVHIDDWILIGEEKVAAVALKSEKFGKGIVVVWNTGTVADEKTFDLSALGDIKSVKPLCIISETTNFVLDRNSLKVSFDKGLSAAVFSAYL